MTALALLMIPILVIPLVHPVRGALAESFDLADYLIWAVFTVDYGVRLYLVPRRWAFVRSHPVDLAVVVLPFLRPLRALRAMRLLAATRLAAFLWTGLSHARAIIARHSLQYVLVIVIAVMLAAAGLEVSFEAHAPGSTIHGYGDALWWRSPRRTARCP